MRSGPRRRLGVALLVVAVAVAGAAAVAVGYRRDVAEVAIRRALADAGLAAADVHVEEADLERLVLTDMQTGSADGPMLRRLTVSFGPRALLDRRIDRIDVEGLDLSVRIGDEGIAIDGLDAPHAGANGGVGASEWTVAAIDVEDAVVTVQGPVGARVTINGEVHATDDGGYRGDARIDGVVHVPGSGPAMLDASLSFTTTASVVQGTLALSARFAGADTPVEADASGAWNRQTGAADAAVRLHPIRFAPGKLQPRDLLPSFELPIGDVDGDVAADGHVVWTGERLRPDLRVRFDTVSLQAFGAHLQDVDGVVRISALDPLQASADEAITIGRIDAGVPISDSAFRFTLGDDQRLRIADARANLLGGQVRQAEGWIDPDRSAYRGVLDVAGLDLQALLDLAELDAATATGDVGGRIPVAFEDGALAIDKGELATEQPGVLRYRPPAPPAALQPQGQAQGLGLALQALENFHYDTLRLTVDGGSGRGWTSSVTISGKNPDFMEGYPFVFNINLSGDLDKVVLSGLLGMTLPDRIQDRLERR